jgi:nucleotide-binding universal stress UspA family protein
MRILLAHDGSTDAEIAADLAGSVPWPAGSTVRVISVIEPTMVVVTAWAGSGGAAGYSPDVDSAITASVQEGLTDVVARLQGPNLAAEGMVRRGRPATMIVEEARAFDADVVLVGSRGRGTIASLALGSVSGEVVEHAPCPVLVARQPRISRVVVGLDGSPSSLLAERLVGDWPIFTGAAIRVVSVADVIAPWHTGIAPTMYAQVTQAYAKDVADAKVAHQAIADEAVNRLRAAGQDAVAEPRTGDAASELIAAAVDWKADLVVLGSRGQTGLKRILLGSVARNVVHGSAASVLVVRDAETA